MDDMNLLLWLRFLKATLVTTASYYWCLPTSGSLVVRSTTIRCEMDSLSRLSVVRFLDPSRAEEA